MRMHWHRRGDFPVDTHVLVHHGIRRPAWLEQCLAALEAQPTSILMVRSDSDHLGQIRAHAMREGTAPWVSWADDDDWLHPGALQACIAAADQPGVVGAYTDQADVDAETGEPIHRPPRPPWSRAWQAMHPYGILHAKAFRRLLLTRELLAEVARWPTAEEVVLTGLLAGSGAWRKVDMIGATKRKHAGAGSRITPGLLAKAMLTVTPSVLSLRPWAETETGCSTCDGVRKLASRAIPQRR